MSRSRASCRIHNSQLSFRSHPLHDYLGHGADRCCRRADHGRRRPHPDRARKRDWICTRPDRPHEVSGASPIHRLLSGAPHAPIQLPALDRGAIILSFACSVPILFLLQRNRHFAATLVFAARLAALDQLISLSAVLVYWPPPSPCLVAPACDGADPRRRLHHPDGGHAVARLDTPRGNHRLRRRVVRRWRPA